MRVITAILITIAVALVTAILGSVPGFNPKMLINLMVVFTAFWAAWDSSKIGLIKYKTGISSKPWVLFVGVSMLWIIGFPWYLITRSKIKAGLLDMKKPAN
jgi:hypothetical protein